MKFMHALLCRSFSNEDSDNVCKHIQFISSTSRPNKNTILPINFIAKNDIKRWHSVSFDCFRNFWTNTRRLKISYDDLAKKNPWNNQYLNVKTKKEF